MKIKTVKCIILTIGYCERAKVAPLIFTLKSAEDLKPNEAVTSLAKQLYAKFLNDIQQDDYLSHSKCCVWHRDNTNDEFCSACRGTLRFKTPSEDDFKDFIYDLSSTNLDRYGETDCFRYYYKEQECHRNAFWDLFFPTLGRAISNGEYLQVSYDGEELLALALMASEPDSLTSEESLEDNKDKYKELLDMHVAYTEKCHG
jgi:hypothetical protein